MDLQLPSSKKEIEAIQNRRKRVAFERAKRAPFYAGKLDDIDPDRLDDPEEWAKIPIIDKETLREIPADSFEDLMVICGRQEIAEYWRSGGATGVPIYYPRTAEDMRYSFLQLVRCWLCAGVEPGDLCHMSFPFGVHPAGQLWSRTANDAGIGIVWVGAGNTTPSEVQLDLLSGLRPTLWMGCMPSYGLHLANLAEARGIDLARGPVRKLLVGAEALSSAKREKLERMWGVDEVRDLFGMTEIGILGADSKVEEGFHIWTDQAVFEVVDPDTGRALPEGEDGLMVITPLFINNATPFLRWSSGDIVSIRNETSLEGPFSVFPVMRHAHRTVGFFKIRGINVNHAEFEDFMFRLPAVTDFRVELVTADDREVLRLADRGQAGNGRRHGFAGRRDRGAWNLRDPARCGGVAARHPGPRFRDQRQGAPVSGPAGLDVRRGGGELVDRVRSENALDHRVQAVGAAAAEMRAELERLEERRRSREDLLRRAA